MLITHINFSYESKAISFTTEHGTHVKLQNISEKFKSWFENLAIGEEVKQQNYFMFKYDNVTVSVNWGPGKTGIKIKKLPSGFIAYNNNVAERPETINEKQNNLTHFLASFDMFLLIYEKVNQQRNALEEKYGLKQVTDSHFGCTIEGSGCSIS